jgi:PAS domain S-box-containing protein
MSQNFQFNQGQFNNLFPFYLLMDKELKIRSLGKSIGKLCNLEIDDLFTKHFTIPRPLTAVNHFQDLVLLKNQLIVIEDIKDKQNIIRGQFEYFENSDEILFIGSPWFNSVEQVTASNLTINDFAHHDPLIDLLHVLKAQDITNDDLKKLVVSFNKQKEDLKKANKEIHDIALFPTQNPDPLIRINFDGDILLNNPAAALLDFFIYNGSVLRNDEFFKIIADKIDKTDIRWNIEAQSGERVYSFVCVSMMDEGYINIYGRDITERNKTQDQLTRLSLVASANKNGVLFTNTSGFITWANEGFCNLTGYSMEEIIGKSPVELCSGALTSAETLEYILDCFFKGVGFTEDIIYYKKDGSFFWGRSFSQPLKNENGNVSEFFGIIEDVTHEKINKEKLEVLSKISEENLHAVIIADEHGKITWVNKSFIKLTGYSLEEVIGKKPGSLLQGPETDPETVQYLAKQIANGDPFNADIINYTKSGEKYWLRIRGQAIKNDKGKITGYFALEEDITLEKESENLFKRALESIGDNVWEHDFQTGATLFSKSNNDFLGFVSDEIADYSGLWWSRVHDEDLHILIENDKKYKDKKTDSHSLEYRIIHKDGSVRWVLDRGVVIQRDAVGNPLKIIGTHTDITNSKQNEIELANRVKQFQSLSENIPGVIYEFVFRKDGSSGLNYISPAIEKIFGIRPDDFKNYLQYIHPEDREMVVEKNQYSRETLSPFYAEARLLIPGQPIKWHSVHSSYSYQTEEGDIVFTGFMLDITDRKNIEQKLDEQRRFYEGILNNMPADIAVFNKNHEYLFVNPMGIKDDELRKWIIGKKDEDYCAYRNKPVSIVAERRASFNKVIATKNPHEWEERSVMPDGTEKYMLRRWYPVINDQKEVGIVIGYGIDITERRGMEDALRHNEEKYRSIIENMNLGLIEVDMNGDIQFANQTLLKMTDQSESDVIGNSVYQFVSSDYLEMLQKLMGKRTTAIHDAFEMQTTLDTHEWWLISTANKYDISGKQVGNILICLDITQQKQLEKDLIKSREQAEVLAKTKESFLANMSHEIRTPMNAILGMGNQLAKTYLNEKQSFYLDTIRTAAENLLVIINDILDLSKIEAGKLTVEKIGFEPKNVCENAIRVLMHKAEEKGLKLSTTYYDARIAEVLLGDPYRLNQILLNLIGNAIKFTEVGSVEVNCILVKDSISSQVVRFSVKDSGIGMEQGFVSKLFDKFSQEYESITRNYGGTGLGMSICKELVELMGGRIYAESEKGKGTTLSFEIEFSKGAIDDLQKEKIVHSVLEHNFLLHKKILVTDDNQMNRLLASIILKNHGADVLEASNGMEAIQIIKTEQPDLVLMDIQMPIMNGYDATKLARDEGYEKPIVALTANAVKGEHEKCKKVGMNDYMSKPFKEEEFLRTLANWLSANERQKSQSLIQKNNEMMEYQYIDLTGLREVSHGDEEFIKKMLQLFTEQASLTIEEIKNAYSANQMEQVKKIAHRIKPSIDTLGIVALKDDIRDIEKNADAYGQSEKLSQLIDKVETILTNTLDEIKNHK